MSNCNRSESNMFQMANRLPRFESKPTNRHVCTTLKLHEDSSNSVPTQNDSASERMRENQIERKIHPFRMDHFEKSWFFLSIAFFTTFVNVVPKKVNISNLINNLNIGKWHIDCMAFSFRSVTYGNSFVVSAEMRLCDTRSHMNACEYITPSTNTRITSCIVRPEFYSTT